MNHAPSAMSRPTACVRPGCTIWPRPICGGPGRGAVGLTASPIAALGRRAPPALMLLACGSPTGIRITATYVVATMFVHGVDTVVTLEWAASGTPARLGETAARRSNPRPFGRIKVLIPNGRWRLVGAPWAQHVARHPVDRLADHDVEPAAGAARLRPAGRRLGRPPAPVRPRPVRPGWWWLPPGARRAG